MKNHETMTLEECYEALVEMGVCRRQDRRFHPRDVTLDAIAAAMPEGWIQHIVQSHRPEWAFEWGAVAFRNDDQRRCESHADTEILARARLAVACWRASKETP